MSAEAEQQYLTDFFSKKSKANDELFEEYLEEVEWKYPHKQYNWILKKFKEHLGDRRVANASPNDVRDYMAKQAKRGLREASINLHLSAIKGLYRWINTYHPEVDAPNLESMRANYFTRNVPKPMERVPLTDREREKLVNKAQTSRDKLLISMFCYTGLRVSEMSGLQLEDVEVENDQSVYVVAETAKLGKPRKVPFPRKLVRLIQTWLNKGRPSYTYSDESEYFFVSKHGQKLSINEIRNIVKDRAEKAGIQGVLGEMADGKKLSKVTPHTLRVTFATNSYQSGMRIVEIQNLMGLSNIETTRKYIKVDERRAFDSYRKHMG